VIDSSLNYHVENLMIFRNVFSLDSSWLFLLENNYHVATWIVLDCHFWQAHHRVNCTRIFNVVRKKFAIYLAIVIIQRKMLLILHSSKWSVSRQACVAYLHKRFLVRSGSRVTVVMNMHMCMCGIGEGWMW